MTFPLLGITVLVPLLGALAAGRGPERGAARRIGIRTLAATGILGLVALALFEPAVYEAQHVEASPAIPGLGVRWALGLDGVGVVLSPVVSLLGTAILVAAPRDELTPRSVRAVLVVVGASIGAFLSLDAMLFFVFATLALVAGRALLGEGRLAARRAYTATAILGTVTLAAALATVHGAGLTLAFESAGPARGTLSTTAQAVVLGLATLAVLGRMGVPPLHSWLAIALRDGQTAAAVLFVSGASLGLSLMARLPASVAPDASPSLMEALVVVGIGSALYCAVVGLGRDEMRSAVGSVASSQGALMLVGIASLGDPGVSGALLGGLASVVACTGLALALGAVRARTGTTDVVRLGGLVRTMPRATAAYFVFSIALVGFPGSLAFVSEDLLLHGLIETHPAVAIALLGVTALNGLTLLRAGVRAFLGPERSARNMDDLTGRERGIAFALALGIGLVGLAPGPLLAARRTAAERVIGEVANAGEPSALRGERAHPSD